MRTAVSAFAIGILLFQLTGHAHADTVRLSDGRSFDGRVISGNDEYIVFEAQSGAAQMRLRLPRSRISDLSVDQKDGVGFAIVPIHGPIGFDPNCEEYVSVAGVKKSISEAMSSTPDLLILDIDSPGGSVQEMSKIVDEITSIDCRVIAWVHDGLSAAAVIAMACPEIILSPSGRIGAAVPYSVGPEGTPELIEEKFQSAIRAEFRRAAQSGGHSESLVLGMMDADIQLVLVKENGSKSVRLLSESPDGTLIKEKGRILTLTGNEAVDCGLALGVASSLNDIRVILGIDAWHETTSRSRFISQNVARSEQRDYQRAKELEETRLQRQLLLERYGPELDAIVADIESGRISIAANERALHDLWSQRRAANAAIERQYEANLRVAYASSNPYSMVDQARAIYESECGDLVERFDPLIASIERELNIDRANIDALLRRGNEISKVLKQATGGF